MERVNAWTTYSPEQEAELMHKAEAYKAFLNAGKTERQFTHSCNIYTARATNTIEAIIVVLRAVYYFSNVSGIDDFSRNVEFNFTKSNHSCKHQVFKISLDAKILRAVAMCRFPETLKDFIAIYNLILRLPGKQTLDTLCINGVCNRKSSFIKKT